MAGIRACASVCGNGTIDGFYCQWSATCSSRNCVGMRCRPCESADCSQALCEGLECGVVSGLDCGTCGSDEVCDATGHCAAQ
jgi:hypothetical protein